MRRAQTYPEHHSPSRPKLYARPPGFQCLPPQPRLLALPCSETIGMRQESGTTKIKDIWMNIFKRKEDNEQAQEYHEPSPTIPERNTSIFNEPVPEHIEDYPTDESLTSPNDNAQMLKFSERFEEYMKGHMLLRDLLDPHHTTSMLRIFFGLIIGVMMCITFAVVFSTISEDLNKKKAIEYQAIVVETNQCVKDYFDNRCEPERRIEHLREYCLEKEKCMNQNPSDMVSSLKMTASLLGEILNEFVHQMSYQALGFFLILVFGVIFVLNCALFSHPPRQEFRRTPEYNELHSRLLSIERLSAAPRNFALQNGGSGRKQKLM